MNLKIHGGNVSGDAFAQIDAAMNMTYDQFVEPLVYGGLGPLDAPEWLNTGHMVTVSVDGKPWVQFQKHTLRDGYRP